MSGLGRSVSGPQLSALHVADPPAAWEALGFRVGGGVVEFGGVRIVLGGPGTGITAWEIDGIAATAEIDGLETTTATEPPPPAGNDQRHPNGALGLDHVVIVTPDFDRTARALDAAGLTLRRVREADGFRQGFRRAGPVILELVEAAGAPEGPARFWGLVVIVGDLDALHERLAPHLGTPKPAVQPGRRIATLRRSAGLSPQVAFMTPEA